MLDTFRSLSGSLPAKILLVLLVLSFGVWGIGDMLRRTGSNLTIATVGSETISGSEFAHALHIENDNVRRMMGDHYSPELIKSLNLPPQVLHNLINRTLMQLESQSLGLVPSDTEVVRHIRSNPIFQDSKGNFNKAAFEAMLRNLGMSEKSYVDQLRQDMASGLLLGTLMSAVPVSDTAARTLYDARQEQRSIALYKITPLLVESVPPPTDAQITAYYNDHKNEFTAPEYRSVSYITISPTDLKETAIPEEELRAAYKDRLDEFKRPERRTVEQLLYSSEDKAKAAEALLKNGKSVADVAKQTEILNKDAVSLGKVAHDAILPNAADAVFALATGGNTAPIQSPFGWHIFHVSAIEPPATAPFEEVRPQLEKELKQSSTGDAQSKLSNKVEDALAGGETLQEAAKDLGLKLYSVGPIDHKGLSPDGTKSKDIPAFDKFIESAFKTDDKTESSMLTAKGGVYYLLRVDNVIPERARTLDEVRGLAVADWQKEERDKRLEQLAKDIAAKFSDPATRAAVIAKYNLQPTNGAIRRESSALGDIALPPQLAADSFQHQSQQSTNAYAAANGDYVIAVVTGVIAAPPPEKDAKLIAALAEIRRNLSENAQNEILEEYTHYLAQKYTVSVNEAALESVMK